MNKLETERQNKVVWTKPTVHQLCASEKHPKLTTFRTIRQQQQQQQQHRLNDSPSTVLNIDGDAEDRDCEDKVEWKQTDGHEELAHPDCQSRLGPRLSTVWR